VKKIKAPELKLSELKLPQVLKDLYSDLRDRRLLPLVALVLVAIVATPFLLGGGDEVAEPTAIPPVASGSSTQRASLTVLPAAPGLREPSKRLRHRAAKNPFRQHYTGPVFNPGSAPIVESPSSGGSSGSGSESGGSSPSESPPVGPAPEGTAGGGSTRGGLPGSDGGKPSSEVPPGLTTFSLQVTLQITRIETKPDGTVEKKGPTLYKDIQAPAALPGEKTPVITYLGMGSKTRVPMFLVSNEVTAIYGETECLAGAQTCQLLVLEEGFPITFVYGDNDVRYKINLIKAEPVVTGHS
jgi:hypothetical protein